MNVFFSTCQVCKQFTEAGFMADADLDSSCLLNKKIRNAQLAQYNFILGEKIDCLMYIWLATDSRAFSAHFCCSQGRLQSVQKVHLIGDSIIKDC